MRQPGSAFKPFVYATAINSAYDTASRVFTAATVLKDEKKTFTFDQNSYAPNNYGGNTGVIWSSTSLFVVAFGIKASSIFNCCS